MNDNIDIDINQTKPAVPLKWMWLLFGFYAAGVVVSLASNWLTSEGLLTWVSKGILMVTILCLLQLTSANIRYGKAALLNALSLVCALIPLLLAEPVALYLLRENVEAIETVNLIFQIITLAEWVLSLLAIYQEYRGHKEITADDATLSRNWGRLLLLFVAAALLSAGLSYLLLFLYDKINIPLTVFDIFNIAIQVFLTAVHLLYLWLLYRTIQFCKK